MLPILYLYFIKKKRNKQHIHARNIFITMIPILHYEQKGQAINFRQKYIHYYDTCTYLSSKAKLTSNKFAPEIFSLLSHLYLYFIKTKKKEAINLCQKYCHSYDTYISLWTKRTSNKFAPEIFSLLWYRYFSYISSKPKTNK